jgi:ABC-type lipoprotein release transport system permease subunit
MKNIILAWRNLWRKPWRTAITSGSIFFGVLFSAVMTSMQYGSYGTMIDNVVKFYSGYAQIFTEEYHDTKSINDSFELNDSILSIVTSNREVTHYAPRLEYFTLASNEENTKGSIIIGIDPEAESIITNPKKWINEGHYLTENDNGVMVAVDLAKYLQVGVGDTVTLLSQGYHGVTAAGKFPVRAIIEFPNPELNKQFIYMSLQSSQEFFGAEGMLTSLVLMVEDHYRLPAAMSQLRKDVKPPFKVMSWAELQPELVQMIEGDRAGGTFMKGILYMIITFGIFGTILMMISERKRELGVMIAIGMQRNKLGAILFFETLFIGLIGVVAGVIGSIPLTYYFYRNPIPVTGDVAEMFIDMGLEPQFTFSMHPDVFLYQAITVFIISMVIAFFPVYKAYRIELTKALRA